MRKLPQIRISELSLPRTATVKVNLETFFITFRSPVKAETI